MKAIVLCLILLTVGVTYAQDRNKIIEDIRDIVETIRMDTALKSVTVPVNEFPDSSNAPGELTGFYRNNKIYYIYRSAALAHGEQVIQFYYWKNKPVFISEKITTYVYNESLKTFDYTLLNTTYTGYYYINKDSLIQKKVTGNKNLDDNSDNDESDLLKSANLNFEIINKRIK